MDRLQEIPLEKIEPNPYQPRETFDKDKIQELADSFKTIGIIEKIVVRPHGSSYQIAAGERRWRAAQMAKMETVECIVRDLSDKSLQLLSLAENLHREALSSVEEEKAVYQLWIKYYEPADVSMADMSRELGKHKSYVSDHVTAYQRRLELGGGLGDAEKLTTKDIRATQALDKQTARKLLKAKADGDVGAGQVENLMPALNVASPERRKEIVAEVIKAGKLKKKYDEDVQESATAYAKGYNGPTKVGKSVDAKKLAKVEKLWEQVRWWGPEVVMQIQDSKMRKKAIEALSDSGEHLTRLAARMWKEVRDD